MNFAKLLSSKKKEHFSKELSTLTIDNQQISDIDSKIIRFTGVIPL
jgi:hypothetical protein